MTPMLRLQDFLLKDKFRDLTDVDLEMACQRVSTLFAGIKYLWGPTVCVLSEEERDGKRRLCYNYLVGWHLLSLYPDKGVNVGSSGAMPLQSKSIGDIHLVYRDLVRQGEGMLTMLTTNVFGLMALEMIQSAPENFVLYR